MPLGYGEMSFVLGRPGMWNHADIVARNTDLFSKALLTEVMPRVEAEYHVSSKREDRAIVGSRWVGLSL